MTKFCIAYVPPENGHSIICNPAAPKLDPVDKALFYETLFHMDVAEIMGRRWYYYALPMAKHGRKEDWTWLEFRGVLPTPEQKEALYAVVSKYPHIGFRTFYEQEK